MTMEEYAATRPPAPCGQQKEHVFWTEIEGFPCPRCGAIEEFKRRDADENRMAEKIAVAVLRQLNQQGEKG